MPFGLGKNVKKNTKPIKDTKNKFGLTHEEMVYYFKNIQEEITNQAKPRTNAVEVIHRLKKEGKKIVIITARVSEFHDDPYLLSKNWLDKNKIEYDKIIVNAREKGSICQKENIDIFIDDQLNNCLDVLKKGIKVIKIGKEKNKEDDNGIVKVENWEQIYKKIKEME